jgi:hypothetical protein
MVFTGTPECGDRTLYRLAARFVNTVAQWSGHFQHREWLME